MNEFKPPVKWPEGTDVMRIYKGPDSAGKYELIGEIPKSFGLRDEVSLDDMKADAYSGDHPAPKGYVWEDNWYPSHFIHFICGRVRYRRMTLRERIRAFLRRF